MLYKVKPRIAVDSSLNQSLPKAHSNLVKEDMEVKQNAILL